MIPGFLASCFVGLLTCAAPDKPADGWHLQFVDNDKLPAMFREASLQRPDGSAQHFYLGNFNDALDGRKPLLIYLEGSGAQSQFVVMEGGRVGYTLFGVIAERFGSDFHVVAPEKRGVTFGKHGQYGTAESATPEYNRHATFSGRVSEVERLLDELLKQPTVDPDRVLLVGHSEGADVAAGAAAADPRVTHVAFLSGGGPTQLFDLAILRRKSMAAGGASAEEIEEAMSKLEDEYREVLGDPDSETRYYLGHAYRRWSSFVQHPPIDSLLKTDAQLFLAHGSEDTSVPIESFDFLVIELLRHGRENVTVKRLAGCDHGFMKPGTDPGYDRFMELLQEIGDWTRPPQAAASQPTTIKE